MQGIISENKLVSPFFLFFLIHASQTGITLLRFQDNVIKGAGHEAWISILAIGLSLHILFFMMLSILKQSSAGDILSFHKDVMGKTIGGAFNLLLACYFTIAGSSVLYSYIDALQIWVFDGIHSWEYAVLLICLVYYLVSGGFRIITGIAFWGIVISSFLVLSLFYLISFAEVSYLTPLFKHSLKDHYISAKEAIPLFLGFETALVYYPFIKKGRKASKWGHIALFFTTIFYVSVTLLSFLFFSQGKLERLTWPTLTMIKIISLPFLERFEFIFIFTWLLVIMPVICIYLWSAVRAINFTLPRIKPTFILLFLLAGYFYINSQLIDIYYSQLIGKIVSISGTVVLYAYIPFLYIISLIRRKLKKGTQNSSN